MPFRHRLRNRWDRSGWPIASVNPWLVAYLLAVDLGVLGWAVAALIRLPRDGRSWWIFGLLTVIAIAFEEGAARSARLQLRLSADLKRDMTSVWAVAGAVALRPAQAVLMLTAVLVFVWRRQYRQAGQPLYRGWFAGSTQLLGCLTAGLVVRAGSPAWQHLPWALGGAISVLLAIVVQTSINRALVTVGLLGVGVRGHDLLGSRDDNLTELATLCLGGLLALAAVHQPWLCLLVLPPMIGLQRGALVRELEDAATIDAKTGLLNAVAWEQLTKRELAHALRAARPLGLLIIDLDHFKSVNDRFGHLAGDAALRRVGKALSTEVREYDSVGRFGGEEFVVLLPDADVAEALIIAERLRGRINDLGIGPGGEVTLEPDVAEHLSVSIGVACAPHCGTELGDLLVAADSALYRAKSQGRNCVVVADGGSGPQRRVAPSV